MSSPRRRFLLVLCGLLFFALYYAWEQSSVQHSAAAAGQHYTISRSDRAKTDKVEGIVPLQSYRSVQGVFQAPQKNLFGSAYRSAPSVSARPVSRADRVAEEQKKSLPVAVAPLPSPAFTVIGHLVRGGESTVFLAAPDGQVHLVQVGTRFAGNSLVQYVDRQEIVIAIDNEEEPLVLQIEKAENMRFPSQRMASGRMAFVAAATDQDDDEEEGEEEVEADDEEEEEEEEEDNDETQGL